MKEPKIFSENTYFSLPMGNSGERRKYERLQLNEVENYFTQLTFDVKRDDNSIIATCNYEGVEVSVFFTYRQSCKNVYKSLTVYVGDKKSNIGFIRKLAKAIKDANL